MSANNVRGEVDLQLGEVKGVICAEMARLAKLSGQLGTTTLQDVYQRLAGAEPMAMYSVVDTMLIDGDVKAMKQAIRSPTDFQKVSDAVLESLSSFISESDEKK